VVAALLGLIGAGSRVTRSRYRPDLWRVPEWLALAGGAAAATLAAVASREQMLSAYPALDAWPPLSPTHLLAVCLALVAGLAAPAPAPAPAPVVTAAVAR
jgi:energy-coupling factor transport system permease protein